MVTDPQVEAGSGMGWVDTLHGLEHWAPEAVELYPPVPARPVCPVPGSLGCRPEEQAAVCPSLPALLLRPTSPLGRGGGPKKRT